MKKRIVSAIMVCILIFCVSIPALAVDYPDLKGHWAEKYMKDLAEKGYMVGSNNQMRPDAQITAVETLALLSRFYALTEAQKAFIKADFSSFVSGLVPSSMSWAYDSLAVCLAAGIVTKTELQSMNLSVAITKEQLSVFLVRTMQLTTQAAALSGTTLSFHDASTISAACFTSVAELVSLNIVSGDSAGNFSPKSTVTRAVTATMVSKALETLKTYNKTLTISAYEGLARQKGVITSIAGGVLDVYCYDGLTREYTVPSSAAVTVNGASKSLSTLYLGCDAEISLNKGTITKVDITSEANVKWIQGAVDAVSVSSTNYIYVRDLTLNAVKSYVVPAAAVISRDGTSIKLADIKNTDFVTIKTVSDVITQINVTAGPAELSGTISSIDFGTTVTLKVTDASGAKFRFLLNIAAPPEILRGETPISIDRLKTGSAVTVKMTRCAVATIIATGTEETVTGELTSISTTKNGTVWVITKDGGTAVTLTLDDYAGVYSGSKSIRLSDIKVGDKVTVVVYNNVITEINLESAVSSADKVSGTVLIVNSSTKVITLLTAGDKLVYINAASVVSIINGKTGVSVYLANIPANSKIVAYGSYSDSTTFTAASIVIE